MVGQLTGELAIFISVILRQHDIKAGVSNIWESCIRLQAVAVYSVVNNFGRIIFFCCDVGHCLAPSPWGHASTTSFGEQPIGIPFLSDP